MLKYGMKYSRIAYWQNQAARYRLTVGRQWAFYGIAIACNNNANLSATEIGHSFIMYANVLTTPEMKRAMK